MKLTSEQLAAIEDCNSAEEIVDKAKELGVNVSLNFAASLFGNKDLNAQDLDNVAGGDYHSWKPNIKRAAQKFAQTSADLDLDELDKVAGAGCGSTIPCPQCHSTNTKSEIDAVGTEAVLYDNVCNDCNYTWPSADFDNVLSEYCRLR